MFRNKTNSHVQNLYSGNVQVLIKEIRDIKKGTDATFTGSKVQSSEDSTL